MKKMFFCLFMVFSINLYSLELDTSIGLGFLGFGFSNTDEIGQGYVQGRFFNFFLQSKPGLGIIISPLAINVGIYNSSDSYMTFLNCSVFYNVFSLFSTMNNYFILGPFSSINAFKHNQLDYLECRAGLFFMLRETEVDGSSFLGGIKFGRDLLFAEVGYSYSKDNKNGFYANIGIDVFAAILYTGMWHTPVQNTSPHY